MNLISVNAAAREVVIEVTARDAQLLLAGLEHARMYGDILTWYPWFGQSHQTETIEYTRTLHALLCEPGTSTPLPGIVVMNATLAAGDFTLPIRYLMDIYAILHSPEPETPEGIPVDEFEALASNLNRIVMHEVIPRLPPLPKAPRTQR